MIQLFEADACLAPCLSGFGYEGLELCGGLLGGFGVALAVYPLLGGVLVGLRGLVAGYDAFEKGGDALLDLLVGQGHAHAVLAKVLKE